MKVIMDAQTYIRCYSSKEAAEQILPIFDRCLDLASHDNSFLNTPSGGSLFKLLGWKGALLQGGYYEPVRSTPPGDPPEDAENFTPVSNEWDDFRPTWLAMAEFGISEIYHVPLKQRYVKESMLEIGAVGCLPHAASLDLACSKYPEFGTYESAVSVTVGGEWAAWSNNESLTVTAGEPALMDRIAALSGGWDYLRNAAVEEAKRRVESTNYEHEPMNQMFKAVGWEVPESLLEI